MKLLKRVLAAFLCVAMLISNEGIISLAQEINTEEGIVIEKTVEDIDSTEEANLTKDADNGENSDVIEGEDNEAEFQAPLLDYLVVGSDYIETPDTQYVLIGLNDDSIIIDSAILHYTNNSNNTQYQVAADTISGDSLLFTMNFDNEDYTGEYSVSSMEYMVGGQIYTIDLEAIGIEARFGVNVEVDANPDGIIVDEEKVGLSDADITITDSKGDRVSEEDFSEVISDNTTNAVGRGANGNIVVVLDPGHGGSDGGASRTFDGVTYIERDINLKIAQYCKTELEQYQGVSVYMTRTSNSTEMDRATRASYANSVGADILVSIHINSTDAQVGTASGSLVYVPNSNYNTTVANEARNVADAILKRLETLGLTNRGTLTRNSSDTRYPDGSLADYYGINYYCKQYGFPGIIVEHAFVNNPSDAKKYFGSEASLKALGVADATGIAEAYGLSKEKEYKNGDAKVMAVPESDGDTYIFRASGIPKVHGMFFAVWNSNSTKVNWYWAIKGVDDAWYTNFKVSDFGLLGTYNIDAYAVRSNGTYYQVGTTAIKISGATTGKITTSNVNASAGTFDITISGITSPAGISKVEIPVWSEQDQSDMHWYTATKQSNGNYTVKVDIANHKYNYGIFAMVVYVTDGRGIRVSTGSKCFNFEIPKAKVYAQDADGQKTFYLIAENVPYARKVKSVRFGVWNSGLDDLHWYGASKDSYGRWVALMPVGAYKKSGTYCTDVYIDLDDGRSYKVGSTTFKVDKPTAKSITASNQNNSAGTFDVTIKGISSKSGVSEVKVPVWSMQDQSDIYWYTATKQSNGDYTVKVDIANHKYNYGVFAMVAYVVGKNGVQSDPISKCINFEQPTTIVSAFDTQSQSGQEFILIAENTPYGKKVTGVRFGVWQTGLSDLKWFSAFKDDLGRWLAPLSVSSYNKTGAFYTDCYLYFADGTSKKVGSTTFSVKSISGKSINFKNVNESEGTFTVEVTGVTAPSGVKEVKIPVWCGDQSNIIWYTAKKIKEGTYSVDVAVANHGNAMGTYQIHVYVYANNGLSANIGQTWIDMSNVTNALYGIMGTSSVTVERMAAYYKSKATYPEFYANSDAPTIEDFCRIYLEECGYEGVKAEVAFCQTMKETGYLKFLGTVKIEQYNFAGIGATDSGGTPATFQNVRTGVRAQVQHLKGYASTADLNNPCVDPRFQYLSGRRGCAPYVEWLGQGENPYGYGWATDPNYGYSMRNSYIALLLSF